jgi:hypothetical protein
MEVRQSYSKRRNTYVGQPLRGSRTAEGGGGDVSAGAGRLREGAQTRSHVDSQVDWVNEIHTWGLPQYGPSCERDIKGVLNFGGVRTSDVHEQLFDSKHSKHQ